MYSFAIHELFNRIFTRYKRGEKVIEIHPLPYICVLTQTQHEIIITLQERLVMEFWKMCFSVVIGILLLDAYNIIRRLSLNKTF